RRIKKYTCEASVVRTRCHNEDHVGAQHCCAPCPQDVVRTSATLAALTCYERTREASPPASLSAELRPRYNAPMRPRIPRSILANAYKSLEGWSWLNRLRATV